MFKFIFEFASYSWSVFNNPLYDWILFAIFGAITHLIVFNLNPFRREFGSFVYWVSYTIVFGILYIFAHIVKWYYYLPMISKIGLPVLIIILMILKEYIYFEPFKKNSKKNDNIRNLTGKR